MRPIPPVPFPLTLLSDELSFEEFLHFQRKTERIQFEHELSRHIDIQAYAVESPESWNAPLAEPEQNQGQEINRLLMVAFSPAMQQVLIDAAAACRPKYMVQSREIDVERDGSGVWRALFDGLARDKIDVATTSLAFPGEEPVVAVGLFARTPAAIDELMSILAISEWNVGMMPGWSCHNRGGSLPIARLPGEVSVSGFFAEANRVSEILAGKPKFLDVHLFALGGPPLTRNQVPSRLILITKDQSLPTSLRRAAVALGAPEAAEGIGSFTVPENHGQSGYFSNFFERMEQHGLTVLACQLGDPFTGAEDRVFLVMVLNPAKAVALLQNLGVGGLEPIGGTSVP